MKLVIVSVRDRAVDAYMRPFFVPTVAAAIRSFTDEVNRSAADNEMYKHPDDYDLYELGSFEDSTGLLSSLDSPRCVCRAKDVTSTS